MELGISAIGGKDSMSGSFLLTKGKDKIVIDPGTSLEDFVKSEAGDEAIKAFLQTDE
jgi:hypothetical protein